MDSFAEELRSHEKKIFAVGFILLIAVVGLTQLSTSIDKSSGDETVTIVSSELMGLEPMAYAITHRKVPEPEGVNIELQTASMTEAELNTLSTRKPIVGILSNVRVVKAYNQGMRFEVMAPWYREGMGANNMTVGQLVTTKNSSIHEPEDLEGKEVGLQGLNGGSALALKTALRLKGVNLSKIDFVGVKAETAPILVNNGEVAAAMFDSSYIVREDFDQNYRTVIDFGKVLNQEYGAVPPSQFVVVREKYYEKDPEKYEKTVQWLRDNYEWARDHKKEISRVRALENDRDYDLLMRKFTYFERIGDFTEKDIDVLEEYYETAKMNGAIDEIPDLNEVFEGTVERNY